MAASLPGVHIEVTRIDDMRQRRALPSLPTRADAPPQWIVLSDPQSVDTEAVLSQLDRLFPGSTTVGCLATDLRSPDSTALFDGRHVYTSGGLAVGLSGSLSVRSRVISGCRPIGQPLIVMNTQDHVITHFDRGPAARVVQDLVESLPSAERERMSTSLCLGLQRKDDPSVGTTPGFVMRSLLGVDGKGVAVADTPQELQVVQFHLRDEEFFRESYREAMTDPITGAVGALMFRSSGLPAPGDSALDSLPVSTCISNGEIAPSSGCTRLHGLVSALAFFGPPGGP